jgi:hypothetical protein
LLGKIGRATVWLGRKGAFGSEVHSEPDQKFKLLVNLVDDDMMETALVVGNAGAKAVLSQDLFVGDSIPVLAIDWPDFGVPQLPKSWWLKFHHDIAQISGHVGIFCHGGHGRTGTAAAILATLSGLVDHYQEDPVKWLRDKYCYEVVESTAQVTYIEEMTGARIDEKPAGLWTMAGVGGASGSYGTQPVKYGGKLKPGKQPKQQRAQPGDATLSKNQFKKLYRKFGHGTMPRPLVHDKDYWLDGFEYRYSDQTRQFVLAIGPLGQKAQADADALITAPGLYGQTAVWAPAQGSPERYLLNPDDVAADGPPIYADLLNLQEVAKGGKMKFGPVYGPDGKAALKPPTTEFLTMDKATGKVVRKVMCAGCSQMRGETCKC